MISGAVLNSQQIPSATFSQQDASFVGEFLPQTNKNHQITALHDVSFNEDNVVYAAIDINTDGIYNWVKIGNYKNGINGKNVRVVTATNFSTVLQIAQVGDILLAGETFGSDNYSFNIGDLKTITDLNPLALEDAGNIRGATGATGATGQDGQNGLTPRIENGYWYIGETNTNIVAQGLPGTNGVDGVSFDIQTPLYSAPANVGLEGNIDPQGNELATLPTLPQANISGKGYVVFDPITTPLTPYYDLYFANNNDTTWTIIHPFTGLAGKNGLDGLTPYIKNNFWYIGNQNTGVDARGLRGPKGDTGADALTTSYVFLKPSDPVPQTTMLISDDVDFNRTPKDDENLLMLWNNTTTGDTFICNCKTIIESSVAVTGIKILSCYKLSGDKALTTSYVFSMASDPNPNIVMLIQDNSYFNRTPENNEDLIVLWNNTATGDTFICNCKTQISSLTVGTNIQILSYYKLSAESVNIVQTTGQSTTDVMSQKAVTDLVGDISTVLASVVTVTEV